MRISDWSSDVCSSDLFARSNEESLKSVFDEAVVSRLADLKTASEEAVAAAQGAAERLARQMLTIADTTASVEARIAEVNTQVEEQNKEEFSRRSAEHTSELQSLMRISYAVFCLNTKNRIKLSTFNSIDV